MGFLLLRSSIAGVPEGSNTPYNSPMVSLRILRPRASGTTPVTSTPTMPSTDPSFFAYPGLEYNVGVAAIGGAYPYTFELAGEPSGMTVDANGVISWPNPDTTTGTITLTVTDALDVEVSTTFAVEVTTTGWFFVDNVYADENGASNGTITRPYKTINAMATATDGSPTARVYIRNRNGTPYTFTTDDHGSGYDGLDGPANETGADDYPDGDGGCLYLNQGSSECPECWIGYPGDPIPIIDCQELIFLRTVKPYMDRVRFIDGREYIVKISSAADYPVFRRCEFDTVTNHAAIGNNRNQGFTFTVDDGDGYFLVIQDCTGAGNTGAEQFGSLYSLNYYLIERNDLSDGGYAGNHSFTTHIGIKAFCNFGTVRANVIRIPTAGMHLEFYNNEGSDLEFCYNKVIKENNATSFYWPDLAAANTYFYRNTFTGIVNFDSVSHDLLFEKNVVQGSVTNAGTVTLTDNLTGAFGAGIVDSNGDLTGGYSEYLGTHGAQIP